MEKCISINHEQYRCIQVYLFLHETLLSFGVFCIVAIFAVNLPSKIARSLQLPMGAEHVIGSMNRPTLGHFGVRTHFNSMNLTWSDYLCIQIYYPIFLAFVFIFSTAKV